MTSVDDRGGSPSVETAVITVVVGVLIAFAVAGGRLVAAESALDQAARAAARAASLQRDASAAEGAARRAAEVGLGTSGTRCRSLDVRIDTAGFDAPIGVPAAVTARLRCDVDWSDLGLPGVSGGRVTEATFASPIDQWRERS